MKNLILPLLAIGLLGLGLGGCLSRATGRATLTVQGPRLAAVGPGVWVVADHSVPIFYSDGYYYRAQAGTWQRTVSLSGSWVMVQANVVPVPVRRIDRPNRYIGYHPPRGAQVRLIRDGRPAGGAVIVRTQQPAARVYPPGQGQRRDAQHRRRDERRDARREGHPGRRGRGAVVVQRGQGAGVRVVP